MTIRRMRVAAAAAGETWHEAPLPLLFVAILSAAMAGALSLLLGWHVFLAASCQVRATKRPDILVLMCISCSESVHQPLGKLCCLQPQCMMTPDAQLEVLSVAYVQRCLR